MHTTSKLITQDRVDCVRKDLAWSIPAAIFRWATVERFAPQSRAWKNPPKLQLQSALKKLDLFDLLVLDDLGYVKKSEAETSVLFKLIAFSSIYPLLPNKSNYENKITICTNGADLWMQ